MKPNKLRYDPVDLVDLAMQLLIQKAWLNAMKPRDTALLEADDTS